MVSVFSEALQLRYLVLFFTQNVINSLLARSSGESALKYFVKFCKERFEKLYVEKLLTVTDLVLLSRFNRLLQFSHNQSSFFLWLNQEERKFCI